jgi:type I restriction enzyme S subunit
MEMLDIEVFEGGFKETELGPLPEEWEVVRLGEVVEIYDNKRVPLSENVRKNMKGIYPYCGANGIIDYINDYIFDGEYVLVAEDGGRYGKFENTAYIMNGKFWVNNHAHILQAKDGISINKFILYWFIYADISQYVAGTTRQKLTLSVLRSIPFPLPPLEEQKAIAGILSTVQSAIEKTEKVINALKNLKKSMMKHLFTYGPVAEEEAEKVELKETEIGFIPKHWEVVRVGEVAEIKSGGTPSRNVKEYWENGTIPWIKSEKCQDCFIYEPSEYITEEGLKNSSAKIFKPHTILIAMVGATAGKTGYLMIEACTNQNVAGLIQKIENLNSLYLFYCLQYRYSDFVKEKKGDYKIANLSFIKAFPIPLPPLEEQQKIAQILQSIDQRIEKEEKYKNALQNLFKSLLHNLMTGKIRVRVKSHGED